MGWGAGRQECARCCGLARWGWQKDNSAPAAVVDLLVGGVRNEDKSSAPAAVDLLWTYSMGDAETKSASAALDLLGCGKTTDA